jgi:outer membrane immunogenic protein
VSFASSTATTFIGGGQVGCNYQPLGSNWVFGVEGDVDWQRWNINRAIAVTFIPFVAGDTFEVSSKWQASARGRIGYAWDRWMLYVTGGAAFTNVSTSANFPVFVGGGVTFPATFGSESRTLVGPTIGVGFEYAFWNNLSFGLEGRYSWYGTQSFSNGVLAAAFVPGVAAPGGFLFAPVTHNVKLETLEVMAKLNFKLF